MRLSATIALLLVGCGCGGAQGGTAGEPPGSERGAARGSAAAGSPQQAESDPAMPDPGPPPVLAARGTPDRRGEVAIAIENRGTTTASLASAIAVQARRGDAWVTVEQVTLTSRADCTRVAPPCQELAPGAALVPPPWLGTAGDAQCECERCAAVDAGTYRFVVRTCDGAHAIAGDAFDLAR